MYIFLPQTFDPVHADFGYCVFLTQCYHMAHIRKLKDYLKTILKVVLVFFCFVFRSYTAPGHHEHESE